jgi:hypothetical protein
MRPPDTQAAEIELGRFREIDPVRACRGAG